MKNKLTYSEKLKDPRWQKKRLEILNRDSFTCQMCFDETKHLHVHHKKYEYGKDPWEIDSEYLVTLCEDCHAIETRDFEETLKELVDTLRQTLSSKGLFYLLSAFGNTPFQYSADLYAEVVDDVFHSDYLEEIVDRKSKGWSSIPEFPTNKNDSNQSLDF
jgi:hypothetical protein